MLLVPLVVKGIHHIIRIRPILSADVRQVGFGVCIDAAPDADGQRNRFSLGNIRSQPSVEQRQSVCAVRELNHVVLVIHGHRPQGVGGGLGIDAGAVVHHGPAALPAGQLVDAGGGGGHRLYGELAEWILGHEVL